MTFTQRRGLGGRGAAASTLGRMSQRTYVISTVLFALMASVGVGLMVYGAPSAWAWAQPRIECLRDPSSRFVADLVGTTRLQLCLSYHP
ncbi:MAG: hypothetical protein FWF90_17415 [Promicromonosporaceae bacterium]|nr:hypothetical protein [Promicromonosporaceae bacterium]